MQLKRFVLFAVLVLLLFVSEASAADPIISFISPTPDNNSVNTTGYIFVNTSISNAPNGTAFINWGSSLQGWWRFNEVTGTNAEDFSGNNRNAILYNMNIGLDNGSSGWNSSGKFGNALSFDGTDDYINTTSFSIPNTNGVITFEFWTNSSLAAQSQTLIGEAAQSSALGYIWIYRNINSNNLYFQYANGTTAKSFAFGNFYQGLNDTWIHTVIVANYTNRSVKVYRNGVLFSTQTVTDNMLYPSTSRVKYIGSFSSALHRFKGRMDEVKIITRELSADEISASYNAGAYSLYANFNILFPSTHTFTGYVQNSTGVVNSTELRSVSTELPLVWVNGTSTNNLLSIDLDHYINSSYITSLQANLTANGRNVSTQRCGINNTGLVGCWYMDETTGTLVADFSGNANNGTWNGNTTLNSTTGKLNTGLDFDGTNDYINIGNNASLNMSNAVTIEAWVNRTSTNSAIERIIGKGQETASNSGYSFVYNSGSDKMMFTFWNGTAQKGTYTTSALGLQLNTWYNLAATYNGSMIKLYKNGYLFETRDIGTNYIINSTASFRIGAGPTGSQFFKGGIDEVGIWNRTLNDSEILSNYAMSHNINQLKTEANSTPSGIWNSSNDNPISIPYGSGELFRNVSIITPANCVVSDITIYDCVNTTSLNINLSYSGMVTNSTSNILFFNAHNNTFDFVLPVGSTTQSFALRSPSYNNLRVTQNTETKINIINGTKYNVSGWDVNYSNGNLTLTTVPSGRYDYIIIDYSPSLRANLNMKVGYYGFLYNQTNNASIFANSSLDWFWYFTAGSGGRSPNASVISLMKSKGKTIIYQPGWWDNATLVAADGDNYTVIRNNVTLYNMVQNFLFDQIDVVGVSNISIIGIDQEAPHNYDELDYVNVSNRLYNATKARYPGVPIIAGTHIFFMNSTNLSLVLRDGTLDDWYLYSSVMSWGVAMKAQQDIYPSYTYLLGYYAQQGYAYSSLATPQFSQDLFDYYANIGIKNFGFWAFYDNTQQIWIVDTYDLTLNPVLRPELYKEAMFLKTVEYSPFNMRGIYSEVNNTVFSNGDILYSTDLYKYNTPVNFSIVPSSDYVNVYFTTWNTTGDYRKVWNETSPNASVITTHTVGDFPVDRIVQVKKNGYYYNDYTSNSTGHINFIYNNGYSEIQFTAELLPAGYSQNINNTGWQYVFVNTTMNKTTFCSTFNCTWLSDWNATSQKYESYKSGWLYRASQNISAGKAVLVKVTSNSTMNRNVTGAYNWTLLPGWNLLGLE